MRVIAGSARRIQLKTPDGTGTRPTTDRIKETLFNMIAPNLCDAVFLDLFSGSGGIGIEALSRGVKETVFVESSPRAAACIKENLRATRLETRAELLTKDVMAALHQIEGRKVFDFIFMDPPYNCGWERKVLEYLSDSELAGEDTVIIVEAEKGTAFNYIESLGFSLIKEKVYKTNKHVFLEKTGREEKC